LASLRIGQAAPNICISSPKAIPHFTLAAPANHGSFLLSVAVEKRRLPRYIFYLLIGVPHYPIFLPSHEATSSILLAHNAHGASRLLAPSMSMFRYFLHILIAAAWVSQLPNYSSRIDSPLAFHLQTTVHHQITFISCPLLLICKRNRLFLYP
jgi:hypothetical protein